MASSLPGGCRSSRRWCEAGRRRRRRRRRRAANPVPARRRRWLARWQSTLGPASIFLISAFHRLRLDSRLFIANRLPFCLSLIRLPFSRLTAIGGSKKKGLSDSVTRRWGSADRPSTRWRWATAARPGVRLCGRRPAVPTPSGNLSGSVRFHRPKKKNQNPIRPRSSRAKRNPVTIKAEKKSA